MKLKLYTLLIAGMASLFISCDADKKTTQEKQASIAVSMNSPASEKGSTLGLNGKIEAVNNAKLSTRMMGYVDKINVEIGDKVRKGQLLVSINNSDLQAKLAQVNAKITEAQAAYNNAEKDYNRFKNLFEENSASQKELDDVTANYEMAKARLEAARQMKNEVQAQFTYVNIRAPFSGVITNKFAEEGDMANPGMPLVAMEAPGAFEVRATVPESEVSSIKEGTEVNVNVKTLDKTIKGVISEVSASAKNTGSQYPVKISLEDTGDEIRSGMYVSVEVPVKQETASERVLIPSAAVVHRGALTGIYTVSSQNTALLRWLRLGKSYGDQVEVLSGLKADEKYIIDAEGKLYNGAPVNIK
ncbi:efflux RND transporter periplasmic adaptor subunit [Gramella jeungdoensis]|uniref:Efflux RND transporter periplasmic adaptor subunit n=1 Tax=Gramella jeungdoensis TaxID=708091 RepID=A0ABT0Z5H8_9FLAO|nr:efflux RND transporter periplasmic adaptor subunit [Gramella jeungdoensis]MCM8570029.1 efflux RND transporter periplasmic adaptor subunit [Gramella jeungdoensis]